MRTLCLTLASLLLLFGNLGVLCLSARAETDESDTSNPPAQTTDDSEEASDTASDAEGSAEAEILAGHSGHGEVFNEGPRQRAYLLEGMGDVDFPATTSSEEAQAFINQGVAQLHGFWYFESERSFRQAAAFDPECAIAYWGMAMSNMGNEKRAKGFIAEAMSRKEGASDRERKYIEALNAYLEAGRDKRRERAETYTSALEKILYEYPDDIEAKALLALQLWNNRSAGLKIQSHLAVDALMQQIFAEAPLHPAHHFCIHLWDYERPEKALASSAACGPSLPGIAHMWHMPGHIYSRLKRYPDAVWQQEASARVDHAHMMRYGVLPDQIHNFAHNNEWLIRNLIHLGRIGDAVDLAKNMIELPRHPKYNMLTKSGCSASHGRTRLFEVLGTFELWEDMIQLAHRPYLEPTEIDREQVKRLRYLGVAYLGSERIDEGEEVLEELRTRLAKEQEARDEAVNKATREFDEKNPDPRETAAESEADSEAESASESGDEASSGSAESEQQESTANDSEREERPESSDIEVPAPSAEPSSEESEAQSEAPSEAPSEPTDERTEEEKKQDEERNKAREKVVEDARRPFQDKIRDLEQAVAELEGHLAATRGEYAAAVESLKKGGRQVDVIVRARYRMRAGEVDEALQDAEKHVKSRRNEVQPLAGYIAMLWEAERREEAERQFKELQTISGSIDLAAGSPVFQRLEPMVAELGLASDWRLPHEVHDDIGERPHFDTLGPFRWQPSPAPSWNLLDSAGRPLSLKQYQGQPVVVIFYLGYGCLHCAEQLHAFAPMTEQFAEAGLSLVAVSSDDVDGLQISLENYQEGDFPFPLVADPTLEVFRAYRAFDDFEDVPLHGTFLIDGEGDIRWHDLSYEPFMDASFVLEEARRLLQLEEND